MNSLIRDILRTVLYYDIFHYPVNAEEVFTYLPSNSVAVETVRQSLDQCVLQNTLFRSGEYYSPDPSIEKLVQRRLEMERFARHRWKIAFFMGHVIKLFPFVRGCFITGTLSKNISSPDCDIDYFIVTKKNRLWICRAFLILFKKIFLLNNKKFFCLNYFITEDALEIHDQNVYTAAEIAHVKPLISDHLFSAFLNSNDWIRSYFPNWKLNGASSAKMIPNNSIIARILEIPFNGKLGQKVDGFLMRMMYHVWKKRYPSLTDEKRDDLFRVRKNISKAHEPDFGTRILNAYRVKCLDYGIDVT